MKSISIPKNLVDYVANVEEGLRFLSDSYRAQDRAFKQFAQVGRSVPPVSGRHKGKFEQAKREVYRSAWIELIDLTGLTGFMDKQAMQEFRNTLETNPPAFTVDNVRESLLSFSQQSETMFQRGVVNVFHLLSKGYARHTKDPFCVPKKIIIERACERSFSGGFCLVYGYRLHFSDLDRAVKVFSEQKFTPQALSCAVNTAWQTCQSYEDDSYSILPYKNGNVHIVFKEPAVLEKINGCIAGFYGNRVLAEGRAGSPPGFSM